MNRRKVAKELLSLAKELMVASSRKAALPSLGEIQEMENWIRDRVQAAGPRGISKSRLLGLAKKFKFERRSFLKALKEFEADEYLTTKGGNVVWTFNPPWER